MPVYQFPEYSLKGCGTVVESTWRITIASQTIATWALSWASPTVVSENPFTDIPDLEAVMEQDFGSVGIDGGTFVCNNVLLSSGVYLSDLFDGYNPFDTRWHIRLEKKTGPTTYVIKWQGMIEPDVTIDIDKFADKSTYKVTFEAIDTLMQLDLITVDDVVTELPHATYDFEADNVYICYNSSGSPVRDKLTAFVQDDLTNNSNLWYYNPETLLRFFKLTDVIEGIIDAMGLTASLNNGGAIDHDWDYYIYDGSSDQAKTFADLHIISATYYSAVYQQFYQFFDPDRHSDISFYHCGTALEMLKAILVPHGMTARIRHTTAGVRYLEIIQLQTNNGTAFSDFRKGASYKPADRILYGIVIQTSNAGDYIRGSSGDGATGLKNRFMSCNRVAGDPLLYKDEGSGKSARDLLALYGGLWARHGDDMYSVYKINAKTYGQSGTSGTGLTANADAADAGMVLGKAMAAYYYNDVAQTSDPIGISGPLMRRLEVAVGGIQDSPAPTEYLDFNSQKWWVVSRKWDFKANVTRFICETREW